MSNNTNKTPKPPAKPQKTDLGVQIPKSSNPKPPKTKGGK